MILKNAEKLCAKNTCGHCIKNFVMKYWLIRNVAFPTVLMKLTELEALMIYKNQLTEIPAVNSASLRTLRLNTNRLVLLASEPFN